MDAKTSRRTKFPGFYECQQHDQLTILTEGKPKTLCRKCFKRINSNLALYLGQTMTESLRIEYLVMQHADMIMEILDRLEKIDVWIDRLATAKTKEEGKN